MLVNSKKFLSFSLNCDETLPEWTGQSMKLFLVYSTDLALKVTVCISWQNLLEWFFFLCWFLFCSAFFLLSLFACLFPVFLCSVSFSVFVILWHGIQKGNTLLKFSKGNALNESLKLNGVRFLLRDSFFFSLSSRWEFSHRDDKEAGTFFFFYTTIEYSENRADVRQSCSKWSIIWKVRWFY